MESEDKELEFPVYTNDDEGMEKLMEVLTTPGAFDISMVPTVPMVSYYNDKGELQFQSRRVNVFYAVILMTAANNHHGWYCTVQGEYVDGDKKKGLKKFEFNYNETGFFDDFPKNVFGFPLKAACAVKKMKSPTV